MQNRSQRRALGRLRSRQPESFGPISWEQGDEANDLDEVAKIFEGERSKHLDTSAEESPFVEPTAEVDGETSCRIDDSLEEFPLLSGTVGYTESKVQSNPSRGKPQQSSKIITFGSFRVSDLLGEPSSATSPEERTGSLRIQEH